MIYPKAHCTRPCTGWSVRDCYQAGGPKLTDAAAEFISSRERATALWPDGTTNGATLRAPFTPLWEGKHDVNLA